MILGWVPPPPPVKPSEDDDDSPKPVYPTQEEVDAVKQPWDMAALRQHASPEPTAVAPSSPSSASPPKSTSLRTGTRSLRGQDQADLGAAISSYRKAGLAYVNEHNPNDQEAFNFANQLLFCLQRNGVQAARWANYPGNPLAPNIVGVQFQRNPANNVGLPLWVRPFRKTLEDQGFETHDGVNHLCSPGDVFIEVGRQS